MEFKLHFRFYCFYVNTFKTLRKTSGNQELSDVQEEKIVSMFPFYFFYATAVKKISKYWNSLTFQNPIRFTNNRDKIYLLQRNKTVYTLSANVVQYSIEYSQNVSLLNSTTISRIKSTLILRMLIQ